tara:strand:- start:116064 stop:117395 length:1332 start_codon:yes stop_codon:yes gene_type:complete
MSDESLDNLFKKGLSGRGVNFNMESWRKMEQMLPPEKKVGFFVRYRVAAIVAGLLFVGTASVIAWGLLDTTTTYTAYNIEDDRDSEEFFNTSNTPGDANSRTDLNSVDYVSGMEAVQESNSSTEMEASERTITSNSNNSSNELSVKSNSTVNGNRANKSITSNPNKAEQAHNKKSTNQPSTSSRIDESRTRAGSDIISFSSENSFTKIDGIGELSTLILPVAEEDNTLVVSMSNSKLAKVEKNTLGFIGGINLNRSLTDPSSNKLGGSEFFGLTYHHFLNGGLSLKIDLLYNSRNVLDSHKEYAKKIYGFGSKSEQTVVESQRLVYLELPAMVNYGIGNHNIMLGGSFSYLATGLHKVTTTYTSQLEGVSYEESMQWGYTNGYKAYDFSVAAGYEYNVSQRLDLGMRLNYGLLDVTNNAYFGNDSFDNNVQLRFYLKYSPFKF